MKTRRPVSTTNPGRTRARRRVALPVLLVSAFAAGALWFTRHTDANAARGIDIVAPAYVASPSASQPPSTPVPDMKTPAVPTDASAVSPVAGERPAVASAGQRAYIDPTTGRLREAEHDDAVALQTPQPRQRRVARPAPVYGPDGAVGAVVPEELHTYMVATRLPDGRIVMEHATGPKAAEAKARAGAGKARTKTGKEEPNDR